MNSAEVQYIWKAIRESERSDENLLADASEPELGQGDFLEKELRRPMRFVEQQLQQEASRDIP